MKITLESTTLMALTSINSVPARVWEGQTETGIPVYCFVGLIAVQKDLDWNQFERELKESRPPSAEADRAVSLRMIL
jgi:hypothetical protein